MPGTIQKCAKMIKNIHVNTNCMYTKKYHANIDTEVLFVIHNYSKNILTAKLTLKLTPITQLVTNM